MRLPRAIRDVRTIRALLEGAEDEALRAGVGEPGAEHLLLAALALPEGSARRAFARLDPHVDLDRMREAITTQHTAALRAVGIDVSDARTVGVIPGTAHPETAPAANGVYRAGASARDAFRVAADLARTPPRVPLCGAHVVAAVAGIEHGTAPRTLHTLGIDPDALATAAHAELAEPAEQTR